MSVRFQQPLINIRERLNHLFNHRHDAEYEKKGTYIGKNLLINGDKTVSQRGDFSTPFVPDSGAYYVDFYYTSFSIANVTINYSHEAYNTEINSQTVLCTVTATNGSMASNVRLRQTISFNYFINKIVTYTALIKSNTNAIIELVVNTLSPPGSVTFQSTPHSGSGEFELLTVTAKIPYDAYIVTSTVNLGKDGTTLGDYVEIGNEQIERGDKFTGFENVLPLQQLINCRGKFLPILSDALYDVIGTFIAVSTTKMQCTLVVSPQITQASTSIEGHTTVILEMLGPATGTITQGTLFPDLTLSDMTHGKLTLSLTGVGFSVGEINIVRKNNDATIIGIR